MELTPEIVASGYEASFDDNARAAHLATLASAAATERDRWPTVPMVRSFAALFGVPVAELGAFFGLLLQTGGGREVWVDVARSPDDAWLAPVERLPRRQAVALGYGRMLAA